MNCRGFLLFEMLMAVGIFFAIMGGILLSYRSLEEQGTSAGMRLEASRKAQSELNRAFMLIRDDFYRRDIKSFYADKGYFGSITVKFENDASRIISSSIIYMLGSKKKSVAFERRMTDPHAALGKSTCSDDFSLSDIKKFRLMVAEGISLGEGNVPTDIDVVGEYAYITTDGPKLGDVDLFIYRIKSEGALELMGSLNTGPGLSSLHVAGNITYVANQSVNGQLQVIDTEDLFHPLLIKTLKLPGIYTDGTVVGKKVLYADSRVYLGTEKSSIAELHVFDASDARNPVWKGSFETGAGINAMVSKHTDTEDILFIATPLNPELLIVDAHDIEHPRLKYSFDAPGGSGNGKSLDRMDDIVTLGRTVGNKELFALHDDPLAERSSLMLGASIDDVITRNNFVFAMTSNISDSFHIYDSSTSTIVRIEPRQFVLNSRAVAMDCDAKKFFIMTKDPSHPLSIISSQ